MDRIGRKAAAVVSPVSTDTPLDDPIDQPGMGFCDPQRSMSPTHVLFHAALWNLGVGVSQEHAIPTLPVFIITVRATIFSVISGTPGVVHYAVVLAGVGTAKSTTDGDTVLS